MTKGVSVIVCCYNSSPRLPETIRHLAQQKTGADISWEILVIDNASTDDTESVARKEWDLYNSPVPFKVINEPEPGLSNARKTGIKNASFEYLLFCDDDNWLNEDYVSLVFEILSQNAKIGVVGGCNYAVSDIEIPGWFSSYESYYAVGCQGLETGEVKNRDFVFGAGMAFRKSVYERLVQSGFHHLLSDRKGTTLVGGGDLELCYIYKIAGYKIWYDSRLILKHYMPANRLSKEYFGKLEKGAMASVKILQVYDPYLQSIHKASWLKKTPLFAYYILRYLIAKVRPGKDQDYVLTYIEACNFLPVKFSKNSSAIKKTIQDFSTKSK